MRGRDFSSVGGGGEGAWAREVELDGRRRVVREEEGTVVAAARFSAIGSEDVYCAAALYSAVGRLDLGVWAEGRWLPRPVIIVWSALGGRSVSSGSRKGFERGEGFIAAIFAGSFRSSVVEGPRGHGFCIGRGGSRRRKGEVEEVRILLKSNTPTVSR